jgi:putative ABC transport system substrate-binding protein
VFHEDREVAREFVAAKRDAIFVCETRPTAGRASGDESDPLELLRELLPKAKRVAVLNYAASSLYRDVVAPALRKAATQLDLELVEIGDSNGRPRCGSAASWSSKRQTGTNLENDIRRAADLLARVLEGVQAGSQPVDLATLVMNLKTARAIGLTVPQAVYLRADRVIK